MGGDPLRAGLGPIIQPPGKCDSAVTDALAGAPAGVLTRVPAGVVYINRGTPVSTPKEESMGVYEEVRSFECAGEDVVVAAITDALEGLHIAGELRWKGRMIEFKHSWHFSEEPTLHQAPIDDVVVLRGSGGVIHVEFGVTLRDPRTGFDVPISVIPDLCEFVVPGDGVH